MALADLPARLAKKGGIGAVLLLPSAPRAAVEAGQARLLCREADPGLPLAAAADGLDAGTLARLFRVGLDAVLHAEDGGAGAGHLRALIERRAARGRGELFPAGKGVPRLLAHERSRRHA